MVAAGFGECWARSYFSFLEGASAPEAIVERAAELGMAAVGVVDRGGLYGSVRLVRAAGRTGLGAMVGAELDLSGGGRIVLLATDTPSYQQLSRAVSRAQLGGVKGQSNLALAGLGEVLSKAAGSPALAAGMRDAAVPRGLRERLLKSPLSNREAGRSHLVETGQIDRCTVLAGGPHSPISMALMRGDRRAADAAASALQDAFPRGQVQLCLQHHLQSGDSWLAAETVACAERTGLGLVASGAPRYALASEGRLLDVLTAIRHGCTLEEAAASGLLLPNHQYWMRTEAELAELLPYPRAFAGARDLAARAELKLDFRHSRFPGLRVPDGRTPDRHLEELCRRALPGRYPQAGVEVERRLGHELEVISKCRLAEFFLIVFELMDFARRSGIPAQGRGSAADSLVAYLLGITRVDPIAHHLLFERFLHEEMEGTPDIDIDISTAHRERLIQHVYDTYGEECTGMVCTVVTFQLRMALRQVGAAMGMPAQMVERLGRAVDHGGPDGARTLVERVLAVAGESPDETLRALPWRQFAKLVEAVLGVPRHLSIHVGGMLVTGEPLWDIAPLERAAKPGRVVVQFDKDDVEDLGLIKIDLLGLRTLSVVDETLTELARVTGQRPDLEQLDLADPEVYEMCSRADTIGVFQIESRAQQQTLPRAQPREFNDLVVEVALVRPGPIQGHAVHPYLRRRQGREAVTYLHPLLEPILKDTLGVILYQEQIMEIAMQVAGFSAGQADRFRRAMNRHRSQVEMASLERDFLFGCQARAVPVAVAGQLFEAVRGFAAFGFCRSHAAAFARTAYETAWLRLHHPAAYLVGLLNHQPMGFYHPSVLVDDARRRGVRVLPVDVNRSRARCQLEAGDGLDGLAVRLGFNYVKGVGQALREHLDQMRALGEYASPEDFWHRTGIPRSVLDSLVLVGALDGFGEPRRKLLWRLKALEDELAGRLGGRGKAEGERTGPTQEELLPLPAPAPALPTLSLRERVLTDYRVMELTTGPHPASLLRPQLVELGVVPLAEARSSGPDRRLRVAGLVITRQAPHSARGMRFFTLADETGHLDLVFSPEVYWHNRTLASHEDWLCAEGVVRAADGVASLLVERLLAMPGVRQPSDSLPRVSHDYH
ncbi:MAG: DNA polymerase III subunit alpha [Candidatus Dormibacteria bacterium]